MTRRGVAIERFELPSTNSWHSMDSCRQCCKWNR